MKKNEVVNIIKQSKTELASKYGVSKLGLFGSYVRQQQNKFSDIDIIVAFNRDIDLFEFIELRELLEKKIKAKIDLVMASSLKPAIGKRILEEVEYA